MGVHEWYMIVLFIDPAIPARLLSVDDGRPGLAWSSVFVMVVCRSCLPCLLPCCDRRRCCSISIVLLLPCSCCCCSGEVILVGGRCCGSVVLLWYIFCGTLVHGRDDVLSASCCCSGMVVVMVHYVVQCSEIFVLFLSFCSCSISTSFCWKYMGVFVMLPASRLTFLHFCRSCCFYRDDRVLVIVHGDAFYFWCWVHWSVVHLL